MAIRKKRKSKQAFYPITELLEILGQYEDQDESTCAMVLLLNKDGSAFFNNVMTDADRIALLECVKAKIIKEIQK